MAGIEALPEIKRVEVSTDVMRTFAREEEFLGLAVSLMVEVGSYASIAAATTGQTPNWDRDHATVGGHMVRLYKLLDAFLDQTTQRQQEISFLLARLIFECIVNMRFLIVNFSKETVDAYIAYSFRHERRLRDLIEANIKRRNGIVLPIEDRMFKSIDRSAEVAGITLQQVDPADRSGWAGSMFDRTKAVGLEALYLAAFGGGSHAVHGNWHDLYGNHLEWGEKDQRFSPNLEWSRPRPQVVSSLALITIETILIYLEFIGGESARDRFEPQLIDLTERVLLFANGHEHYLGEKRWPEI